MTGSDAVSDVPKRKRRDGAFSRRAGAAGNASCNKATVQMLPRIASPAGRIPDDSPRWGIVCAPCLASCCPSQRQRRHAGSRPGREGRPASLPTPVQALSRRLWAGTDGRPGRKARNLVQTAGRPRAGRFRDGCIGSPPTAEANGSFPCLLQVSHRQAPSSRGCSADLATGSVNAATLRARPPAGPKHLDPASAAIAQTAEIGKNASLAHTSSHPAAPASAVKGLWWLLLAIPSIFRDRVTGNTLI